MAAAKTPSARSQANTKEPAAVSENGHLIGDTVKASLEEPEPLAIAVNTDEMFIGDFEFMMKLAGKRLRDPAEMLQLFDLFDRVLMTEVDYRRLKLKELGSLVRQVLAAINQAGKQGN